MSDFLTNSNMTVNSVFLISWLESKTGHCGVIDLVYTAAGGTWEVTEGRLGNLL